MSFIVERSETTDKEKKIDSWGPALKNFYGYNLYLKIVS